MSETVVLKPFQQKAFGQLCDLAKAFHNYQSLESMQEHLWEMLKAALEPSDCSYQSAFITCRMLSLYEQLEAAIPAIYGLALGPFEDKKTKKKPIKKKTS